MDRQNGAAGLVREQIQAGLAALQRNETATAREIFTTLLEANGQLALAHVGLGRTFAAEDNHQRALEHYQEALAIQPDLAVAQLFSAESRERLGDVEEALEEYREAVELDPSLGLGYLKMAGLLNRSSRADEALTLLEDAVRHTPHDVGLRLMLASAQSKAGHTAEAEAHLRRATDIKSDLWIAHYQLGKIKLQAGDFAGAQEPLARAAALAPDKASVHQALGAALSGLGDHARAAKAYDDAYRHNPSNLRSVARAAKARSLAGRPQEGLALLMGLGRVAKRSNLVQKAMGDILLEMGRGVEAAECYRALLLNVPRIREAEPEAAALADQPVPADALTYARSLRDAIGRRTEGMAQQLRADPGRAREWLAQRRARRVG